jgi:hypothetical protein
MLPWSASAPLHKQVILSDNPAVTDSSSTWMPSWRGWSWGDGIFEGLGLQPLFASFLFKAE